MCEPPANLQVMYGRIHFCFYFITFFLADSFQFNLQTEEKQASGQYQN